MSTKNDAEVIINGKVYRLSGYESPEYLQKIATYVNKKINSFAAEENYSRLSQEMKNVLLDINIADDYFKAKNQAESIQTDSESRDRQLYDVKHELVTARLRIDTLEQELEELHRQMESKEKENMHLSAELESAMELMDRELQENEDGRKKEQEEKNE
jgi:cell division protein ZapA